ncbi:hypothetical protein C7E12_09125 [Stenotrophomonas maltophilia]|nr:hypothetical protein C7E12_09125 [Stenotrophomonas maltophilia]
MSENLSVAEVMQRAAQIDAMLDAVNGTAPDAVQAMGGRDCLARRSEMTCIGPVPADGRQAARQGRGHGSIGRRPAGEPADERAQLVSVALQVQRGAAAGGRR